MDNSQAGNPPQFIHNLSTALSTLKNQGGRGLLFQMPRRVVEFLPAALDIFNYILLIKYVKTLCPSWQARCYSDTIKVWQTKQQQQA